MGDEGDRVRTRFAPRFSQHTFGKIHCGNDRSAFREPQRVAPSTAPEIEHALAIHLAHCGPYNGFFKPLERIPIVIVDFCPAIVSRSYRRNCIRHVAPSEPALPSDKHLTVSTSKEIAPEAAHCSDTERRREVHPRLSKLAEI